MRFEALNPSGVLGAMLPHAYRYRSSRWLLREMKLTPAVDRALENLTAVSQWPPSGDDVLKCTDRRLVIRYDTPHAEMSFPACVAKVVFLSGLRRKLKSRRYGFSESSNIAIAKNRGIQTPNVLAFGKLYHRFGLPRATIVISEYLSQMCPAHEALWEQRDNPAGTARILDSFIPVFAHIYRAGCNHIDLIPSNLLIATSNASIRPVVLDFEYTVFCTHPNLSVLMKQAAHFVRRCKQIVPRIDVEAWLHALLDEISVENPTTRSRLVDRFQHYEQRDLSRKERLRTDDVLPIPAPDEILTRSFH